MKTQQVVAVRRLLYQGRFCRPGDRLQLDGSTAARLAARGAVEYQAISKNSAAAVPASEKAVKAAVDKPRIRNRHGKSGGLRSVSEPDTSAELLSISDEELQ